jgi:hypothetical protein
VTSSWYSGRDQNVSDDQDATLAEAPWTRVLGHCVDYGSFDVFKHWIGEEYLDERVSPLPCKGEQCSSPYTSIPWLITCLKRIAKGAGEQTPCFVFLFV